MLTRLATGNNLPRFGQWCGRFDRAVTSDTRGPGFEFTRQQLLMNNHLLLICRKDENKEKWPRMARKTLLRLTMLVQSELHI